MIEIKPYFDSRFIKLAIAQVGHHLYICQETQVAGDIKFGIPAKSQSSQKLVRGYVTPIGVKQIGVNNAQQQKTGSWMAYILNEDFDPQSEMRSRTRLLWQGTKYQLQLKNTAVDVGIPILSHYELFASPSSISTQPVEKSSQFNYGY